MQQEINKNDVSISTEIQRLKNNLAQSKWKWFLVATLLVFLRLFLVHWRYFRVFRISETERDSIIEQGRQYMEGWPVTITEVKSPRGDGHLNDYYTESPYIWPNPNRKNGPNIFRDGFYSPNAFRSHREVLVNLHVETAALVTASLVTQNPKYAQHAVLYWRAWFVDDNTYMRPSLAYTEQLAGKLNQLYSSVTDTVHLVEVARAIEHLPNSMGDLDDVKLWFEKFTEWLISHPIGVRARNANNNHATCWLLQVAAFARLTGNANLLNFCRHRYKTVIVKQMTLNGSFPAELRRANPYGYSLFNLEAMGAICQLLSTPDDNLWTFKLRDGRGIQKALSFMKPFIRQRNSWPFKQDVMYFNHWPRQLGCLVFAGVALKETEYFTLWHNLHEPSSIEEVNGMHFIRQPILWINNTHLAL